MANMANTCPLPRAPPFTHCSLCRSLLLLLLYTHTHSCTRMCARVCVFVHFLLRTQQQQQTTFTPPTRTPLLLLPLLLRAKCQNRPESKMGHFSFILRCCGCWLCCCGCYCGYEYETHSHTHTRSKPALLQFACLCLCLCDLCARAFCTNAIYFPNFGLLIYAFLPKHTLAQH